MVQFALSLMQDNTIYYGLVISRTCLKAEIGCSPLSIKVGTKHPIRVLSMRWPSDGGKVGDDADAGY